jgi:hypothetical protein
VKVFWPWFASFVVSDFRGTCTRKTKEWKRDISERIYGDFVMKKIIAGAALLGFSLPLYSKNGWNPFIK